MLHKLYMSNRTKYRGISLCEILLTVFRMLFSNYNYRGGGVAMVLDGGI
jgi:hypothetical protein